MAWFHARKVGMKDPEYMMDKIRVPGSKCSCKVDNRDSQKKLWYWLSVLKACDSGPEEVQMSGTKSNDKRYMDPHIQL